MDNPPFDVTPVIRGLIVEKSAQRASLAAAIGVHPETFRRNLTKPDSFTTGEVYVIAQALGTTSEEILRRAQAVA